MRRKRRKEQGISHLSTSDNMKKTRAEKAFPAIYARVAKTLPGSKAVRMLRDKAMADFKTSGLPGRGVEAWKYTNLRQLMTDSYPPATPASGGVLMNTNEAASHGVFSTLERATMVFVDGHYRPELSDISPIENEVEISTLAEALNAEDPMALDTLVMEGETDPLANLNLAMMRDGALIRVKDGVKVSLPLHFVHINLTGASCANTTRHIVHVGAGASLKIFQTHAGSEKATYFTNTVFIAQIADKGALTRVKVQGDSLTAFHFGHLQAKLGEAAKLRDFTLNLGGRVTRNEVSIALAGNMADAHVSGAYLLGGKQHCDTSIMMDHQVPECTSTQQFRGVVDETAQGVFQGKVRVAPDAQKSDGRQMVRALLLSERAAHYAKPELEIFADDVQCAHGATAGELDDEAMFFLRARGIPEAQAKALLITAFIGEALDDITDLDIRDRLEELTQNWLDWHSGATS